MRAGGEGWWQRLVARVAATEGWQRGLVARAGSELVARAGGELVARAAGGEGWRRRLALRLAAYQRGDGRRGSDGFRTSFTPLRSDHHTSSVRPGAGKGRVQARIVISLFAPFPGT